MIVTCAKCQTRFKIPDEKVTPEKGVKVRCTRCDHTFRVTRAGPPPGDAVASAPAAPDEVAGPDRDPFASFGSSTDRGSVQPGRPGLFSLGPEGTRGSSPSGARTPGSAGGGFDFGRLAAGRTAAAPEGPAPFDFGALPVQAPPPPPEAGAFDFAALSVAQPPGPVAATAAFDFSALTSRSPPPAPAPPPPLREVAASASTPALDFSSFGSPPPGPAPASAEVSAPARRTQTQPLAAPAVERAPGPRTPEPGLEGFFGSPTPEPGRAPLLDLPDDLTPQSTRSALFDMPSLELPAPPPPPSVPSPPRAPARSAPPVLLKAPAVAAEPPPRRRTALGVVVNLAIAVLLVGGLVVLGSALLNEGTLSRETFSLDALKASFVSTSEFAASDISNGLYVTRAGRSVFFVRGEVTNRSAVAARVVVRAEIIEGSAVVRTASAAAGAVPTPEELFNLPEGQTQDELSARLVGRAAMVAPGSAAEFLVTFTEYPPDLKAFRVRVSARADGTATSARGP